MLDIEVDLAMKDWEEIPTGQIVAVASEARKQAGEFMPTNGLMAKIWREIKGERFEDAQKAIRARNTEQYLLGVPRAPLPTDEEREQLAAGFAELARKLAGEA